MLLGPSPVPGGSALPNSSLQVESRNVQLYLLSTEPRYLATGWEPVEERKGGVAVVPSGGGRFLAVYYSACGRGPSAGCFLLSCTSESSLPQGPVTGAMV